MRAEPRGIVGGVALITDAQEPLHPLSVENYHRMIEAGILTEDDRVELLEGAVIEMSPEGPPHSVVIDRLNWFITRALPAEGYMVRVQHPMTLPPRSEPEPDLAIVDAAASSWSAHPASALLVIEVAQASLRKDRERKSRIYASAGIPEYWVADLVDLCVHVHREPHGQAYASIDMRRPPDELQPATVKLPPLSLAELLRDDR